MPIRGSGVGVGVAGTMAGGRVTLSLGCEGLRGEVLEGREGGAETVVCTFAVSYPPLVSPAITHLIN
jgi:hypothetical protein